MGEALGNAISGLAVPIIELGVVTAVAEGLTEGARRARRRREREEDEELRYERKRKRRYSR